jgi:hypothetical protein
LANGKEPKGLVIVPEVVKKLELPSSDQKNVGLMTYKIDFKSMEHK